MAPGIASMLFFCLLLPHLAYSYHTRYTRGSRQYVVRSTDHAEASTAPTTCSSIPSGVSYGKKLPLVHRLSPCSPLNAAGKQSQPSSVDIFRRDARRVRSLLETVRSGFSDASAPAPAPTSGVTIPTDGTTVPTAPGVQDYTVLVSYGTPAQQFPVALDTGLGLSLLRCKPCLPGTSCDPAFDPAQSSTFTHVPCGTPDCRSNCSGSTCPLPPLPSLRGAVVRDVITLTTSASVHDFTFGCVESDHSNVRPAVGLLDLSRDSRSLASRLSSSAGGDGTPAFSYCLPLSARSHGFLSIGANQPHNPGDRVTYAPLVENPAFPSHYLIELVGMSLGGKDLPIPPTAPIANSTILDVVTSFTFLNPAIYTLLRDAFRREMSGYPTAPPFNQLDTCYNFTGLHEIIIPLVGLKFGNGERLVLDGEQMLYFSEPNPFSVACLGFVAMPFIGSPYSVIGNLAQTSTEVVYDVGGGKVGFIQGSC